LRWLLKPNKTLYWENRKKHTIELLKTASLDIRIVACADKLNNIRTIACDYNEIGDRYGNGSIEGKRSRTLFHLFR